MSLWIIKKICVAHKDKWSSMVTSLDEVPPVRVRISWSGAKDGPSLHTAIKILIMNTELAI